MTTPAADPWCCRVVELAARMLPAEQRQRYAPSSSPSSTACRDHSKFGFTQVLAYAWALRTALSAASSTTTQEGTMTPTTRRPLHCLLGIHRWHWANAEDGDRYQCCLRRDKTESVGGLFRVNR